MGIIKFLVTVVCISILIVCSIITIWFIWALVVNFYKVFIKKAKQKDLGCYHENIVCDNLHPSNPFKCTNCGERF
jgi:hypothetical protein